MKLVLLVAFIGVASSCTEAIQTGILRAKRDAAADTDNSRQAAESKTSTKSYVRLGRTVSLSKGDESDKSKYMDLLSTLKDGQMIGEEQIEQELIEEGPDYSPYGESDVDLESLDGLNKRAAGDRNFVRMGKDGKSYVRMGRDGKSFVRMGKDGKSYVRMGRDGKSFVRMGRDGKSFVRMGKDGKSFVRMGKAVDFENIDNRAIMESLLDEEKRADKSYVRMGKSSPVDIAKREQKTYVRLGRNFDSTDKRASSKQYVRFGRQYKGESTFENNDQHDGLVSLEEDDLDKLDKMEINKKAKQYVRFG